MRLIASLIYTMVPSHVQEGGIYTRVYPRVQGGYLPTGIPQGVYREV